MQPSKFIDFIEGHSPSELLTRIKFAQVCKNFVLKPAGGNGDYTQTLKSNLDSFNYKKEIPIPTGISLSVNYGENGKMQLFFKNIKNEVIKKSIVGIFSIDEKKQHNDGFKLEARREPFFAPYYIIEIDGIIYLHIFANTKRCQDLLEFLRPHLGQISISVIGSTIEEDKIKELKKKLGLKSIEEYIPNFFSGVSAVLRGELDESKQYLEVSDGKAKGSYVFRTPHSLTEKTSVEVFRLSPTGLTHFRTGISMNNHLKFIKNHIIPISNFNVAYLIEPIELPIEKNEKKKIKSSILSK